MNSEQELPEPLTPEGCDLRNFPWFGQPVEKFRRSRFWLACKSQPAIGFFLQNLMMASFHEVPAASVEDDDIILADLAMCSPEVWPDVKSTVLASFVKCRDGRLYSPFMAEVAKESLEKQDANQARTAAAIAARKRKSDERRALATSTSRSCDIDATSAPHEPQDKTGQDREDSVLPVPDNTAPASPSRDVPDPVNDDLFGGKPPLASPSQVPPSASHPHSSDARALLRGWGVETLLAMTGLSKGSIHAWLGGMLKDLGDDKKRNDMTPVLNEIIQDAVVQQPIDPKAWIAAAVKRRTSGGRPGKPEAFGHIRETPESVFVRRYRAGEIDKDGNEINPAGAKANDDFTGKTIDGEVA